jgi:hypothetical protein
MREWLRDVREGFRIMRSRRFWRSFRDYWSTGSISARMDAWTSRVRENTGQEPDWDVEKRIAKRRAEKPPDSEEP